MTTSNSFAKQYTIDVVNHDTVERHIKRIVAQKKQTESIPRINYVNQLITHGLGWSAFLQGQHGQRIGDCRELILCDNLNTFRGLHFHLSSFTGEAHNTRSIANHERQHYDRAQAHNVLVYYAIGLITQDRIGTKWQFRISPTVVALIELKAIEEQWDIKKYVEVTEDILDVSDLSSGDSRTLEAIKAIKVSYGLE